MAVRIKKEMKIMKKIRKPLRKSIISFALAIALVMGAVPLPPMGGLLPDPVIKANAAEYTANPTTKDELVPEAGSGSVSEAHEVRFAGKDWYVIGYDGVGLASESGTMTLFLKGTLGYQVFSDNYSNVYADSSIHSYLESYLANTDNFTSDESAAVVARTLSGGGSTGNSNSGHVSGESVDANLWLLSAAEARKLPQSIIKSGGEGWGWWLRSPASSSGNANFMPVSPPDTNDEPKNSGAAVGNSKAVRAAMLLDLDSVIYSSDTNTLIAQEAEAHSITVSVDGDKGSVDAPSRADKGETVRFTITPAVGYAVDTVKFNDTSLSPVNDVYSFTMPNVDVTISVTFAQIYRVEDHIEQDGDTYTIKTAKGWEVFCDCVKSDAYNGFGGKTVKLGLDITDGVTVSAGIPGKPFYGAFDGCGHTLTVALNSTDEEWVAPFSVFSGSIKNLTVTGTVAGSGYAGGLTGLTFGGSIENVTVNADISGSSKIGGITGYCNFGSLSVKNAVFNGSLQCDGDVCGLIGWASENVGYNQAITIENCLFNGTYTCDGEFHPITVRNADSEFQYTENGAYYTVVPELSSDDYIICAGIHVSTITADNEFEITTDPTCSFYSVDYYAEDTSISLRSTGSIEGVVVNNGAVAVTDNKNGTYSFTMPEGKVTVENKRIHSHSFTYAAENATITATCDNSDGFCRLINHQATLTIAVPEHTTYGDGKSAEAQITDADNIRGSTTVSYYAADADGNRTGSALDSAPEKAGKYRAEITLGTATAYVVYTVAKADPSYTEPTNLTAAYGQTLADVSLASYSGWAWKTPATSVGNVGSNSFPAIYTKDNSGNYNTVEKTLTVTVGKRSITGATVTLSKTQLEYNGSLQSVSVTGVGLDGKTLTTDDYEVTGDTSGTAKDTYTVTVTGKGNYKDSATATWEISGKPMTVTAPNVTATYDGAAHGISVQVTDPASGYTIRYGDSAASCTQAVSPTITNVSDSPKTVYFKVTADNYADYTGSAKIMVGRAAPTIGPLSATATYGDTMGSVKSRLNSQRPTGVDGIELNGSWSWVDTTVQDSTPVGNVGDHTYQASFAPTDTNYDSVSNVDVTVTVEKADIPDSAITQPQAETPTYDGGSLALVSAGKAEENGAEIGTMWYAVTDSSSAAPEFDGDSQWADKKWSTSVPAKTDAGTYYVWYMVKGDGNHNPTAVCQTPVVAVIGKADAPTSEISIEKKYLYSRDNSDSFTLTGLPDGCGTVTWKEPTKSGSLTFTTAPAVSGAGVLSYRVAAGEKNSVGTVTVVAETKNYNDITFTVSIRLVNQIPIKLKSGATVSMKNGPLTYGQKLSVLQPGTAEFVTDDESAATITAGAFTWKEPDIVPNAGTYSAAWVFTPADPAYASCDGTSLITVNKASINPGVSLTGWSYGSSANSPSVSGNTGGGPVSYAYSESGKDNYTGRVPTEVGDYTVKAVIGETGNYLGGTAINSFRISKAASTLTVSTASYSKTYGDGAFVLEGISSTNTEQEILCKVTSGADVITVSGRTVSVRGVGNAVITVSQPAGPHYEAPAPKTISVTVSKKSFTPAAITKSYPASAGGAESLNLSGFLPEDCGTASFAASLSVSNSAIFAEGKAPKISEEGVLTYSIKEKNTASASACSITVKANSQYYSEITFTVQIALTEGSAAVLKKNTQVTLKNSVLTYGSPLSALQFNTAYFVDADKHNTLKGTLTWKNPDTIPSAGTTSALWVFTPDASYKGAYANVEGSAAISVLKADPVVVSLPTVPDRVYDPEKALTDSDLKGGSVRGVNAQSVSGSWSFARSGVVPDAGLNTVDIRFIPFDPNYNVLTKQVTVSVSKAQPTVSCGAVSLSCGKSLYEAEHNAQAFIGTTKVEGNFAWEKPEEIPSAGNGKTYTLLFTPKDTANYNTAGASVLVNVQQTATPNSPAGAELTAKSWMTKVSEVDLSAYPCWDWNDQSLSSGTASYTARYIGPDAENYTTASRTAQVRVTKETGTEISLYEKVGKTEEACYGKELTVGKSCTLLYRLTEEQKKAASSGAAANTSGTLRTVWVSSNPDVATVNQNGSVMALSAGKTTIEAISEQYPGIRAVCEVRVLEPVASIRLDNTSDNLGTNETLTLTATVLPLTADQKLTWTSSNENIAKVERQMTSDGGYRVAVVTGGATAGTATITASAEDGSGKQATCKISVGSPVQGFTLRTNAKTKAAAALGTVPSQTPYLEAGKTMTMGITWTGATPKNQNVVWSVSDASGNGLTSECAQISDKGVLTGLKEGLVQVKAVSAADETKSATMNVFVYNPLQSAALNTTSGTLSKAGGTLQLAVKTAGRYGNGSANASASFTSSSAGAIVDPASAPATGITPASAPTVKYSLDPNSALVKNYPVSANGNPLTNGVLLESGLIRVDPSTGLVTLKTEELDALTAKGTRVSGSAKIFADVYTWNGTATGVVKRLTCTVSIAQSVSLKSIKLSKTNLSLGEGNQVTLTASTNPVNPDTGTELVWSIADTDKEYLTITPAEDGTSCVITGNSAGVGKTVKIMVASKALQKEKDGSLKKDRYGNTMPLKTATCSVKITPAVSGIEFTNLNKLETAKTSGKINEKQLSLGKSFTFGTKLDLSVTGKGGAATKTLRWESSNPAVVSVDQKGTVRVLKAGTLTAADRTVTITAYCADEKAPGDFAETSSEKYCNDAKETKVKYTAGTNADGAAFASFTFTVYTPVKTLTVDKTKLTLGTIEGTQYGRLSIGSLAPADATVQEIVWTTNNDNVQLMAVPQETVVTESGFVSDHSSDPVSYTSGELAQIESRLQAGTMVDRQKFIPANDPKRGVTTPAGYALAVRAVKPGTAVITGRSLDRSGKTVKCTVTIRGNVTELTLKTQAAKTSGTNKDFLDITRVFEGAGETVNGVSVKLSGYKSDMKPGTSLQLTPVLQVNGTDAAASGYNTYKKNTDMGVSYRSSNTDVATVSGSGRVSVKKTMKDKDGKTVSTAGQSVIIYASDASGRCMAQLTVTVK